jgi:hypothetical protein
VKRESYRGLSWEEFHGWKMSTSNRPAVFTGRRQQLVVASKAPKRAPAPKPSSSSSPSWLLPTEGKLEPVELRQKATPSRTIVLGQSSWDKLRQFAGESQDGRETGGFLFGDHVLGWNKRVGVRWVTSMVTERAEASAQLDIPALVAEKAVLRASGVDHDVGEIGSWHSHPGGFSRMPSPQDLSTWINGCDFLERSFYVNLILTRDASDEWRFPHVHGWTVYRDRSGHAICEPAAIDVDSSRFRRRASAIAAQSCCSATDCDALTADLTAVRGEDGEYTVLCLTCAAQQEQAA